MKPPLFEYHRALTLEDAVAARAANASSAILAGGQSLLPTLNFRLGAPDVLIDVSRIGELDRIEVTDTEIRIGAMVRQRRVELDDEVYRAYPLLRETLGHVAHIVIRNRGTVVGSLAHADAAAEMPAVLLASEGRLELTGPKGDRTIAADEFFRFHLTTALGDDEIITAACFPRLPQRTGWAFGEFTRRRGDYAIAGVCALVSLDADGRCERVRLTACGIGSRPIRLESAERLLVGTKLDDEVLNAAGVAAAAYVEVPDDTQASQAYRAHLLATLVTRTTARAARRSGDSK